jgi:hypothetical protein
MALTHLIAGWKVGDLFRIRDPNYLEPTWLHCKITEILPDNIFYHIYEYENLPRREYVTIYNLYSLHGDYILEKLDMDEIQLRLTVNV